MPHGYWRLGTDEEEEDENEAEAQTGIYLRCFDSPILRGGQKKSGGGGDGDGDDDGDGQTTVERPVGGILLLLAMGFCDN